MDRIARTPEQLGLLLRARRKKLALSQTQVGDQAGIKQDTVSVLEISTAGRSIETLYKVLSAMDLELVVRDKVPAAPEIDGW